MNYKAVTLGVLAGGVLMSMVAVPKAEASFWPTDLITKLASRFRLNETEVKSVFTQFHEERQAERTQEISDKLSAAVTAGIITETQKQLILNKHKEQQELREKEMANATTLTRQQRREQMQKHREEMDAWAKANNIPADLLFGGNQMHGRGMGRGFGQK